MSIAAAYPLCELEQHLKRPVAPVVVLAASLVWCSLVIGSQCGDADADIDIDIAAFRWIATHAENNALVVSASRWAPYFTRRETAYTPLPASEARNDERVLSKRRLLLGESGGALNFSRASRRATYIVAPRAQTLTEIPEEVYRGERAVVYKITP